MRLARRRSRSLSGPSGMRSCQGMSDSRTPASQPACRSCQIYLPTLYAHLSPGPSLCILQPRTFTHSNNITNIYLTLLTSLQFHLHLLSKFPSPSRRHAPTPHTGYTNSLACRDRDVIDVNFTSAPGLKSEELTSQDSAPGSLLSLSPVGQ